MKDIRASWFPVLLGLISVIALLNSMLSSPGKPAPLVERDSVSWSPPDINLLPDTKEADRIRYGRELIVNTSKYLGPHGVVGFITNGMNCQNCHVDAGTRLFGSPLITVASTYPKFRERSGRVESIEYRVNECLERSLNGKRIDSLSNEMRAFVAYMKWLGQGLSKGVKLPGTTAEISLISRAADPQRGSVIYESRCMNCHGKNGEGELNGDSSGYRYPPLWGESSFNVSAGLYRIMRLASFVKYNMPFTASFIAPQLSDEEAWDVAAYILSQPRTEKFFSYDWPNIATKAVDQPFGPYADGFTEQQHKFGPYQPIIKAREEARLHDSTIRTTMLLRPTHSPNSGRN